MRIADDELDYGEISQGLMGRLAGYLRPYRKTFVIAFGFLSTAVAVDMMVPWLTGQVIDAATGKIGSADERVSYITTLAWCLLGGKIFQLIASYIGDVLSARVGQSAIQDLRTELFSHVLKKPLAFFMRHPVGRLVTRVSFDLENIAQMYTTGVVAFVIDVVLLFGFAAAMLLQNTKLGLAAVGCLPVFIIATLIYRKIARPVYLEERKALSRINAFLAENIAGVREVKLFVAEDRQMSVMRELVDEHLSRTLQMLRISSFYMPGMATMTFLVQIGILVYGSHLAVAGELSLGTFVAFIMYLEHFFRPIREIGEKITIIQIAAASAERIFMLLDDDEVIDPSAENHAISVKGQVAFKDVHFAYEAGRPVLKGLNFEVRAGERVALVGPTGAGKTSVLKLLQRFWDVQEGSICVDGIDVRSWKRDTLRQAFGSVQQDVHLFSGSIEDNITLGVDSVSRERVECAAEAVQAAEFIERMPDGFESEVQEGGRALSAGQRQLVSFARIFAANPSILLLDEATSSIDTQSEQKIQEALDTLMSDRTCFIIAHRLSTVMSCDRIFVIDDGQISEEGSHAALLARKGLYAELVRTQVEEG